MQIPIPNPYLTPMETVPLIQACKTCFGTGTVFISHRPAGIPKLKYQKPHTVSQPCPVCKGACQVPYTGKGA